MLTHHFINKKENQRNLKELQMKERKHMYTKEEQQIRNNRKLLLVFLVRPDLIPRPYPEIFCFGEPRFIVGNRKCKNFS